MTGDPSRPAEAARGKRAHPERRKTLVGLSATQWGVTHADAGRRLDVFLAAGERLGSRGRAAWALERGKVFVNEHETSAEDAARRLEVGDHVRMWMDRPGSARARHYRASGRDGGLHVVYEDDVLLVVNKPAGLLTVPLASRAEASSVAEQLAAHLRGKGKRRPLVVHRIDRDTSGLVVFATSPPAQHSLKEQFARREPERVYLAVVEGNPHPSAGVWEDQLVWDHDALVQTATHGRDPHGKPSRTEYQVVESFERANASLLQLRLVTGKRNQIRVQAQLHGHPLLGERMYVGPSELRLEPALDRQALHAWRLAFRHPATGRPLVLEAPPPEDFELLIRRLRSGPGSEHARKVRSPKKVT